MEKEYRIKEQKYKHGSLFLPQYRYPFCTNLWTDLPIILNLMEEAIKVIEKDIEKEKEQKVEETIIHNYPLNQNKDENDRYYTPSIEEFHIGFEFEEKPKGCTEFEGWVKQTIHKGGSSIENHFNSSKLRVKYLDQEDIESLGFIKYTNNSVGENINVVKTINSIEFDLQNIKAFHKAVGSRAIMAKGFDIDILLNVDTNTVHIFDITKDKYPIFKGTIKNKSELKKVLKMLNIN